MYRKMVNERKEFTRFNKILKDIRENNEKEQNKQDKRIEEMEKKVEEMKKSENNFFLKWLLPILSVVITGAIGCITLNILNSNQPLVFESTINPNGNLNIFEDSDDKQLSVEIPLKIDLKKKSGETKTRLLVMNEDINHQEDLSFLAFKKDGSDEFEYKRRGIKKDLERTPIDFFIVYIDYNDNIDYEYHLLCPEYRFEDLYTSKGNTIKMKSKFYKFTKYEMISDFKYKESVQDYKEGHKNTKLIFSKHKDVKTKIEIMVDKIKKDALLKE
ncbi:hypothetical protein [Enterococcus gilvus]|nr:hypothetical protein [Enterococcus gilvus]